MYHFNIEHLYHMYDFKYNYFFIPHDWVRYIL
jgi:hypothetical protein